MTGKVEQFSNGENVQTKIAKQPSLERKETLAFLQSDRTIRQEQKLQQEEKGHSRAKPGPQGHTFCKFNTTENP